MNRNHALPILAALAVPLIAGALLAAPEPGGRFYERLREAEEKLSLPPRSSNGNDGPRPGPNRVYRPRVRKFTSAAAKRWPGFKVADVTYSVDPRSEEATSPKTTGDVILIAEPEDVQVFFNLKGGAQLFDTTQAVIRSVKPQKMHIVAWAPEVHGKSTLFMPVKANHITTIRLAFPDPRKKKAATEEPTKPASEGEKSNTEEKPANPEKSASPEKSAAAEKPAPGEKPASSTAK